MTDINTMNREELEAHADVLGVDFKQNIGDENLRKKLNAVVDGGVIEQEAPEAPKAKTKGKKKEAMYKVTIMEKEGDEQPVPIGVNGVIHLVKRGHEVLLSEPYVTVLRNANKMVQNQATKKWSSVPSYPFQAEKVS